MVASSGLEGGIAFGLAGPAELGAGSKSSRVTLHWHASHTPRLVKVLARQSVNCDGNSVPPIAVAEIVTEPLQ